MTNTDGALDDGSQGFSTCGTTSLVVIITDDYIICCNTGDSRAVLASEGASRPLSRDHKPEIPDEQQRYCCPSKPLDVCFCARSYCRHLRCMLVTRGVRNLNDYGDS